MREGDLQPMELDPASRAVGWRVAGWPVDALDLLCRAGLAAVFLWAGVAKALDHQNTVLAVDAYRVVPQGAVQAVATALPWIEILVGLFLTLGAFARFGGAAAAALGVIFIAGMAQAKARGLSIDCGCFGGGATGAGVTWFDMIRDVPLVAAGVFLAVRRGGPLRLDRWLLREE